MVDHLWIWAAFGVAPLNFHKNPSLPLPATGPTTIVINGILTPTWKAKWLIFKAIVAGFRVKLPKKIGHLAFQVLVITPVPYIYTPIYMGYPP